ncbi:MAG: elongation factor EF-2 [Nanoarchaeota archaeon]|nr:elongation factor EF-2 [Nanoarchaeota archaeon]
MVLTAEKLYSLAKEKGALFEESEEQTIYDTTALGLKAFSLNKETGELEKKPVALAWKLDGGKLIKVKLRNGFEISTTPEHKYIALKDNDFKEVMAGDLKIGNRIVCPREMDINENQNLKESFLKKLAQKDFYVVLKKEQGNALKKAILSHGLGEVHKRIHSKIKLKSFYHGAWKNRYHIRDALALSDMFGVSHEGLYDNIESVNYRNGAKEGKSSLNMRLPSDFKSFFYLAGLMFGDGSEKKFVVGKDELGAYFAEICKSLGINVTYRNYAGRTPEIVASHTLLQVLNTFFGYPLRKKSHTITVPDIVLNAPKECAAAFVRGYFDTDGGIEKARKAVSITSASKTMIDTLQFLLLRFGCASIKAEGKYSTLYISGNSLRSFRDKIGFALKYKAEALEQVCMNITGSLVADTLPLEAAEETGVYMQVNAGKGITVNRLQTAMATASLKLQKLMKGNLCFIEVVELKEDYADVVYDFTIPDNHNFIAEGMVIHNTTFSDNLLSGAGMLSGELAGKACALDFHADEKERGITIDSASVSMVHTFDNEEYLINLIDTPGHIDFGGDVTRAMRAVDGAIVLCCAVEGIMPQTETVLRQALRERVKPVLFINKVDRLIKEVKLTPEAMQQKFVNIIAEVNRLIEQIAPEEYKQKWKVKVEDGSVAFGSAFHNWALNFPYMQKSGIKFKDVIDAYSVENGWKELAKKAPIHQIVLNMVVRHHPNPKQAQGYRVPKLWHGDLDSPLGQALINCDRNGPVAFVVTKIVIDKHAGEIAAGRLFSGTVSTGTEVYLNMAKKTVRLQQVSVYKGAQRVTLEEIPCGNIIGLVGLKGVFTGETVSSEQMEPFEAIKHIFEPVITKSIRPKNAADLPKLVEVLKAVGKEDPTVKVEINEETGENLISGMGELHLEIIENRMTTERGMNVITSTPIVVYRETVQKPSGEFEGKTPNKHNRLYFIVEPIEDNISEAIKAGEIPEMRLRKKDTAIFEKFVQLGYTAKDSKNVSEVYKGNMLVDDTRGIVQIGEIIGLVQDGFEQVCDAGGLAAEPCTKMKVRLMDCKLHEDAIHRGPAQMYPAVRDGIRDCILDAKAILLEPIQIMQIECPAEYMGDISKLIQNKRGQLLSMDQQGEHLIVKAAMPVAELFGWSSELRSATSGRGSSSIQDQRFDKLPESLQLKVINSIRQRKGMAALK